MTSTHTKYCAAVLVCIINGVCSSLQRSPYDVAGNLQAILQVYDVKKPPPHVNTKMVFDKIIGKVLMHQLCR